MLENQKIIEVKGACGAELLLKTAGPGIAFKPVLDAVGCV